MNARELIKALEALPEEHKDRPVTYWDGAAKMALHIEKVIAADFVLNAQKEKGPEFSDLIILH